MIRLFSRNGFISIIQWYQRRITRKQAEQLIEHATHVLNMREDILSVGLASRLNACMSEVRKCLRQGDLTPLHTSMEVLTECIHQASPIRRAGAFRDNIEVLVVAISVAMALRAYVIQPFQIPTGSMQPTLYGIHSWSVEPALSDYYPFKLVKWVVWGEWYRDVRAPQAGTLSSPTYDQINDPAHVIFNIGRQRVRIPKDATILVTPGTMLQKGQRIWSGIEKRGDHVFVNKVLWNFRRPRRGDIMVFKTMNIPTLPENTFYIKRLVGLPGETISIREPNLVVDGITVRSPESIRRVAEDRQLGYAGFLNIQTISFHDYGGILRNPDDSIRLKYDEYLAMGDNTRNSRDSRYWGAVTRDNLVGPAWLVYWPYTRGRWGVVD